MWQHYRDQRLRSERSPRDRAVIVASRWMQAEYARHGVEAERLHRIQPFPTGSSPSVDPPPPHSARKHRQDSAARPGDRDPKGGHLAIEAVSQASLELNTPLQLIVAGDGPDRPRLERASAPRLGAPVEFVGWVDAEHRDRLICQADVLVVPVFLAGAVRVGRAGSSLFRRSVCRFCRWRHHGLVAPRNKWSVGAGRPTDREQSRESSCQGAARQWPVSGASPLPPRTGGYSRWPSMLLG